MSAPEFTERDQAVLAYLRRRRSTGAAGWTDASMIAHGVGIGRDGRKVAQTLRRLHTAGLVEKFAEVGGWPPEWRAAQ